MDQTELFRNIGKIVEIEFYEPRFFSGSDQSKVIGYINSLSVHGIDLAPLDPNIEKTLSRWERRDGFFKRVRRESITQIRDVVPTELNIDTINSIKVCTPVVYRYRAEHSISVGYIRSISPNSVNIVQYDPLLESHKKLWQREEQHDRTVTLSNLLKTCATPLYQPAR